MAFSPNTSDLIDFPSRILKTELPKESDHTVIRRALNMFQEAVRHPVWRTWRENASKCYRYREGDQWTAAELAELAERGQPPSIQNEIRPYVERIQGQFLATRQTTTFLGRNSPQDDDTANVLADLDRFTDQDNGYEFIEPEITKDGLTGGIGWLCLDVGENELGQPRIEESDENPFYMFPDPFFKKMDLSDCRYICHSKWVDLEDVIALAPDREADLTKAVATRDYLIDADLGFDSKLRNDPLMAFIDPDRERVRPVEFWYRRKMRRYQIFTPDGVTALTVPLGKDSYHEIRKAVPKSHYVAKPTIVDQMWCGMFLGGVLLFHRQSPRRHQSFKWIPFVADRKKNGEPFGPVLNAIPIQDEINKRKSKSLNMLSNRRIIAEKNAIDDPEEAQIENAKADGYIEVANGALAGNRVVFPDNRDIGQAQMGLLGESINAMPRVIGVPNEMMGMPSEVRSGVGIAKKQQMGNLIQNPIVNNLRAFRFAKAKLKFQLIKEVFTGPMTFQVTDDPNAARLVEVTASHVDAIKQRIYDVVVTDAQDYTTLREQELDMIFKLLPQAAQLGPQMMAFAISLTNLREKKALISMLQQAMQPPPQLPKLSLSMTWADLSDQEKAFVAMSSMQSPQLAQFLMERAGDPAWLTKIKADMANVQVKEGLRAEVERGKIDFNAAATAMEGMLRSKEIHQAGAMPMPGAQGGTSGEGNTDTAPPIA